MADPDSPTIRLEATRSGHPWSEYESIAIFAVWVIALANYVVWSVGLLDFKTMIATLVLMGVNLLAVGVLHHVWR